MTWQTPTIFPTYTLTLGIKPRSLLCTLIPSTAYMRPFFTRKPQKEFILDQRCSPVVEHLPSTQNPSLIPSTAKKKEKQTNPNSHNVPKWAYDILAKAASLRISLLQEQLSNSYRTGVPVVGLCSLWSPENIYWNSNNQSTHMCELSILAVFFQVHTLLPYLSSLPSVDFCPSSGVASCLSCHPMSAAHCSGLQTGHLSSTLAAGQALLYIAARRIRRRSYFLLRILLNYHCFFTLGQHLQPNWIPPGLVFAHIPTSLPFLPNEHPGPPMAQPSFLFLMLLLTLQSSDTFHGSVLGSCLGAVPLYLSFIALIMDLIESYSFDYLFHVYLIYQTVWSIWTGTISVSFILLITLHGFYYIVDTQ